MRDHTETGQGTLEYIAVLCVVAVVLVFVSSVPAAPAIVNGVGRSFQRALCLLTHSGCAAVDPRPCTVRTTNTGGSITAKLAFVRIGREAGVLRALRSDGSVDVTLIDHVDAGLTAGIGADGHLRLGSLEIGTGAVAQAEAVMRLGGGRSWHVKDEAAARSLERRLTEVLAGSVASGLPIIGPVAHLAQSVFDFGQGRDLPPQSSRTLEADTKLGASLDLPAGSGVAAALGVGIGVTIKKSSGARAVLLHVGGDAGASIAAGLGGLSSSGGVSIEMTFDRAGRPVELTAAASGAGGARLGGGNLLPEGLAAHESGRRSVSASMVLDLTEPHAAAAAARLVHALSPAGASDLLPAAGALADAMRSGGRLDVQRYGTRESGLGAGATVGLGAEVGVDAEVTRATSELLDAWTRPAGGAWERRIDCLG